MVKVLIVQIVLLALFGFISARASVGLTLDETEVSIGDFSEFAEATGFISLSEKNGGMVYEIGWVTKPNWNWRKPYGLIANKDEPAVHITFSEAEQYCKWKGKRLPTREEWIDAGYTESRAKPADGFKEGKIYEYPTGDFPQGANCLSDCGAEKVLKNKKQDYGSILTRGNGHSPVGLSRRGVNGLYDMGANVWEWARLSYENNSVQATMGGSWWYGSRQMRADYKATKPQNMAAVYIGFRCIKEARK